MIRQTASLEGLSLPPHPQLTRIWSLYGAYGSQYDFCRFYLAQNGAGVPCAVFCVLDGGITLYGWRPDTDEELADFIRMQPFLAGASVCSDTLPTLLKDEFSLHRGNIMVKKLVGGGAARPGSPDFRRAYRILEQVFPGYFPPGGFDQWYCDASHRIRHGAQDLFLLEDAATGSLGYGDGEYALISQVAVQKSDRGKGIGSRLLTAMEQAALGKSAGRCRTAVYSKDEGTDRFYQKNGYVRAGIWTEISRPPERIGSTNDRELF